MKKGASFGTPGVFIHDIRTRLCCRRASQIVGHAPDGASQAGKSRQLERYHFKTLRLIYLYRNIIKRDAIDRKKYILHRGAILTGEVLHDAVTVGNPWSAGTSVAFQIPEKIYGEKLEFTVNIHNLQKREALSDLIYFASADESITKIPVGPLDPTAIKK